MKKLFLIILAAMIFTGGQTLSARNGSAIIPHYFTSEWGTEPSFSEPCFHLSNISDSTISVTITFYKSDGTVLTDSDNSATTGVFKAENITNYSETQSGVSVSFDLAGLKTAQVKIRVSSSEYGFGVIEYSQSNNKIQKSCVAGGYLYRYLNSSVASQFALMINRGMPF